jgi:hypothetical protein
MCATRKGISHSEVLNVASHEARASKCAKGHAITLKDDSSPSPTELVPFLTEDFE